jgi:hypothetical protein
MKSKRSPIVTALADLNDGELKRLIVASYGVPQTAPGLLAWVLRVLEWLLQCAAPDRPQLAELGLTFDVPCSTRSGPTFLSKRTSRNAEFRRWKQNGGPPWARR